jgi:hypothetical protein
MTFEHRKIAFSAGNDDLIDLSRHQKPLGRNQFKLERFSHRCVLA